MRKVIKGGSALRLSTYCSYSIYLCFEQGKALTAFFVLDTLIPPSYDLLKTGTPLVKVSVVGCVFGYQAIVILIVIPSVICMLKHICSLQLVREQNL